MARTHAASPRRHARAARPPRPDARPPARSLPGPGARACTWPTRAEPRPRRWPSGSPRCKQVDAVYASPLERTRETAAPIARRPRPAGAAPSGACSSATSASGPAASSRTLAKLPEWTHGAALPERLPLPRRRVVRRDAGAHRSAPSSGCAERHPGGVVVAVSHADPIKAAVAHALGTHLDLFQRIVISPCSVTAIAYGDGGPDRALRELHRRDLAALAVVSERATASSTSTRFTAGTDGPPGPAGLLPPGRGRRRRSSRLKLREGAGRRARRSTSPRCWPTCRRPTAIAHPGDLELRRAGACRSGWSARSASPSTTRRDRIVVEVEERSRSTRSGEPDAEAVERQGAVQLRLDRGPGRRLRRRGPPSWWPPAGRRARFCGGPLDPDGHVCPRMNGHRRDALTGCSGDGEIEVEGRMPWSSNGTFLVDGVGSTARTAAAIYKPVRGERPLWDFPPRPLPAGGGGVACCPRRSGGASCPRPSSATGPLGEGSLQRFVAADFEQHYFTLLRGRADHHDALRAHLRVRPAGQQHRPQERPLPARRRRPDLGHRPRPVLPRRAQAAHRDLGLRRRARARRRSSHDVARRGRLRAAWRLADLLDDEEVAALQRRAAALVDRGDLPDRHQRPSLPVAARVSRGS